MQTKNEVDKRLVITVSKEQYDNTLELTSRGFAALQGSVFGKTLKVDSDGNATSVWQRKQSNALDEYRDSHIEERIHSTTQAIYKLFGAYIGNAMHGPNEKPHPVVLDVGCGVGQKLPLYIRKLFNGVDYYGLDAIDTNLERDYPFICARIESLVDLPVFHNKFDTFIFGTSLDHFESVEAVAQVVRTLAAPGALVIFWIGLHDAPLVASDEGARAFHNIFDECGPLTSIGRALQLAFWKFPRVFAALQRRRNKLIHGENLDKFHFWYFTEKELPGVLAHFGDIMDISIVPGGNSVFATCRV